MRQCLSSRLPAHRKLDILSLGRTKEHCEMLSVPVRRLSAYWLGKSPETFYRLYTGAALVLFATRLYIYRLKGWVPSLPHLLVFFPLWLLSPSASR